MKRLVADTGPLLHLHEAGALHLLPLIGKVYLPPQVSSELHSHAPSIWAGKTSQWLELCSLSPTSHDLALQWQSAGLIHHGEAEALALALENKPDWFLTDDAAARLLAESLGIEVRGSIGVVLWAAAKRLVGKSESEYFLTGLEQSSLWISKRVRSQARAALERLYASN